MERAGPNLSFEQWVTFVFDHPLPDPGTPGLYHNLEDLDGQDYAWWAPSDNPGTTAAYLTRLFEHAPGVLAPFSDAQVMQGLWFLVDPSCSDHLFALRDPAVSWPERKRCLLSIFTLFERFFAPRCSSHLSHLDTQRESLSVYPLQGICYMWWDLLPLSGRPGEAERAELDAACLDVMQMVLGLDSDACRESALHGLGHWAYAYSQRVEKIINTWLAHTPEPPKELKTYALAARRGRVL